MMYSLVPTRPLSEDFSLDEPTDSIELERVFCDAKMVQIATTEFAGPPISIEFGRFSAEKPAL